MTEVQAQLTETNRQFERLNTVKTNISKQCTWEREQKEKLQQELVDFKRQTENEIAELIARHQQELAANRSQLELEAVRSITVAQPIMDVKLSPEYVILKKENDAVHKSASKTREQLEDARSQVDRLCNAMWNQEKNSPPSYSLFRAYEVQRDTLLVILNMERASQLDSTLFDRVWQAAAKYENQNLVCEMIMRGDFQLTDFTKIFTSIGHLGARSLLYYFELERQLHNRRQVDMAVESHREIRMQNPSVQLTELIKGITQEELKIWRTVLLELRRSLLDRSGLLVMMSYVQQREEIAQRGELNNSQYIYAISQVETQITETLSQLDKNPRTINSNHQFVQLTLPHSGFTIPPFLRIRTPVTGSVWKVRFLGNFESLFDHEYEKPLPTWRALNWILEDYGLSRGEEYSWDLVYKKLVDATWSRNPPPAVMADAHFCNQCDRRFKWAPDATIDSVEYNWPLIPGQFDTSENCAEAYSAFCEKHKNHTDPVCFRAAIFANFLAKICGDFKVIVNVNQFDRRHPEFHIDVKLRYNLSRWKRMLEIMSMTHFLYGANGCFINEFGTTKVAVDKWLREQESSNTRIYQEDDSVRKEVSRLKAIELRHAQQQGDHHRNKDRRRV